MQKCNRPCPTCPYIQEGKEIKGNTFTWKIKDKVDCNIYNCIYMIECDKERCRARYIGESERPLRKRFSEHKGYVNSIINTKATATGEHFNQPGHSSRNMKITIIEKVKNNEPNYRKERESYHIKKFNTFYKGINRQP